MYLLFLEGAAADSLNRRRRFDLSCWLCFCREGSPSVTNRISRACPQGLFPVV